MVTMRGQVLESVLEVWLGISKVYSEDKVSFRVRVWF